MQTVSIETSVVSFLRENPSASAESVERQLLTRKSWTSYRHRFELVTSQYVIDEARVGQPDSFPVICTPKDMLEEFGDASAT